jgi:putative transposase
MKDSLWSIDLFRCESATLRTHWVLVVMDQYTRRILGFGVHAGKVDGVALCGMFNRAIRGQRGLPKYVSSDNDPLYRFHQWQANLRILEVAQIKSIPYVPLSHPFVERLIGTIRREYLDHLLFWTTADLENKLLDFRTYFNNHRTHTSREGRTPDPPASRPIANLRSFSMATPLSGPLSDTGGCLICQRLAFAAIFGQPRQNFQEIIRCFSIAACFAAPSLPPVASRK